MNASVTEKSSTYELTWSLSIAEPAGGGSDRALKLEYAVKAFEELYIADRLWDYDAEHRRIPDPFGVYRFVRDGSLRLVFAQAPHPPNVQLGRLFQPLYSRIRAGETRHNAVLIKLPVDEYSALERDINAPTALEEVSRVLFVLGYRLRSTMDKDPWTPAGETPETAGYVVYAPSLILSEIHVDALPVKRRTGYMARFPLPGEPKPAPIPVELLR
jgi:hypothetical protein